MFADGTITLLNVLIFLTASTLAFSLLNTLFAREAVRRRAARVATEDERADNRRSLRYSGLRAAKKLIDYTTRHYSAEGATDLKALRQRLILAGVYDPHAAAYYFLARGACAVVFAVVVYFSLSMLGLNAKTSFWFFVFASGGLGYLAPSLYLDRRIAARRLEHQAGFPDFMDLLVVCADAGLSMEASLDRVGRELGMSYPSLAANIHMANLEIRAGRTMTEALEHLGDRLGLEEARSFATLIAQSDELGSSISNALRIYSDDMRHKRLSRAEEKAYSLPAKLAMPMMVCIFPVLFIVILCPVIVRVVIGLW
jgi:tight adherence protein C